MSVLGSIICVAFGISLGIGKKLEKWKFCEVSDDPMGFTGR